MSPPSPTTTPEPAEPDPARTLHGARVLLGVSGGVAAYKAASLTRALVTAGAQVQAVLTEAATEFVGPATFAALTGRAAPTATFDDAHRIAHVAMAREADVALVAPATANVLAKMAGGLADDLLTSTLLCVTAPVVVAPAMHTEMWAHPATVDNVATLRRRGVVVVGPDEGALAGGDEGPGRLATEAAILAALATQRRRARGDGELAGARAVVTAGATAEPLDPVRVLTNRSSGRMGYAVAAELARRGADVDLVAGPGTQPDPPGVRVTRVDTAVAMHEAVLGLAGDADVVVGAAAVSDFRPAEVADRKIAKDDDPGTITLARNPDILADVGARRRAEQVLVGFAAETHDAEAHGTAKLERKRLDLVVVNRVDEPGRGFAVDTNAALLLDADGGREDVALTSKAELAERIVDRVVALRAARRR